MAVAQASLPVERKFHSLEGCATMHYLIVDLLFANPILAVTQASCLGTQLSILQAETSALSFIGAVHFFVARAFCV
jgi:hypothetical protein